MSKKRTKRKLSFPPLLASIFILAIFAFPIVTTGKWVNSLVFGDDPRSLQDMGTFNRRKADMTDKPLQPFNEPLLTVTFDDGWETIYSNAMPIMQKYGIKSTQYILAGEFDNVTYLSEEQVRDMQKLGHEVASHSMTHPNLTILDDQDLTWQVGNAKTELEKRFKTSIKDFASPLGAQNDRTINEIKKYYRSQRNTEADPSTVDEADINTRNNFNRYNIIAYTVRSTTTIKDIRALLDYAIANNGWVILTWHQVEDSSSHYSITPDQLNDQMLFISLQPIRTANMGQVLDAIEQQKAAKW